jgi:hypothetical protein
VSEDIRITAAAKAMREKRHELRHLPLARIYEELATVAVTAFFDALADATRERWKNHEGFKDAIHQRPTNTTAK